MGQCLKDVFHLKTFVRPRSSHDLAVLVFVIVLAKWLLWKVRIWEHFDAL